MASTLSIEQVQRAYIAYYSRPGDPGGVEYWASRLDEGETLDTLINSFADSPEAEALYSGVLTADLIVSVYSQLFSRTPDDGGRDYWAGRIDTGELSPGEALLSILEGASGNDLAIIDNKLAFAVQVTDSFDSDEAYNAADQSLLSSQLALVDETESSLTSQLSGYVTEPEPEPQANSLVGTWNLIQATQPEQDIIFTFNEDGTYSHWETQTIAPDNDSGWPGTETGTYEWDEEAGILTALTVTSDGNGDWGLSDITGGGTVEFEIIGGQMTVPGEGLIWEMA